MVASNIKSGVNIFGVTGTYDPSAGKTIVSKTINGFIDSEYNDYLGITNYAYGYATSNNFTITLTTTLQLITVKSPSYICYNGSTAVTAPAVVMVFSTQSHPFYASTSNVTGVYSEVFSTGAAYYMYGTDSITSTPNRFMYTKRGTSSSSYAWKLTVSSDLKTITFNGNDTASEASSSLKSFTPPSLNFEIYY